MIWRCNKNRGIVFPQRSSKAILIYNLHSFEFPCLIITHDICGLNLVVITSLPGWHWFYWKGIKSVNHTDKVERASKNVFAEDLKCLSPAWRPFEMIKNAYLNVLWFRLSRSSAVYNFVCLCTYSKYDKLYFPFGSIDEILAEMNPFHAQSSIAFKQHNKMFPLLK